MLLSIQQKQQQVAAAAIISAENMSNVTRLLETANINAIDYYNYFCNQNAMNNGCDLLKCASSLKSKLLEAQQQQQKCCCSSSSKQPIIVSARAKNQYKYRHVSLLSIGRIKPSEMRYCSDKKREAIVNKILQEEKIKQIRRNLADYEQFRNYTEGFSSNDEEYIEENVKMCLEKVQQSGTDEEKIMSKNDGFYEHECTSLPRLSTNSGPFYLSFSAKLALIQQEMGQLNGSLFEAESEVMALQKRVHALEVELEQSERKLHDTTDRLEEVNFAVDESERGRKALDQKNLAYDKQIQKLEEQFESMKNITTETDIKMEQMFEKWSEVEKQVENIDERTCKTESKTIELQKDLDLFKTEYENTQNKLNEYTKNEKKYADQLQKLSLRLNEAESRTDASEAAVFKLLKLVERMEDMLIKDNESYSMLQNESNTYFFGF